MSFPIPSELPILGGVYIAPSLVVVLLGLAATWLATRVMNRTRLARFFWKPSIAFVAMWALSSATIGLFLLTP